MTFQVCPLSTSAEAITAQDEGQEGRLPPIFGPPSHLFLANKNRLWFVKHLLQQPRPKASGCELFSQHERDLDGGLRGDAREDETSRRVYLALRSSLAAMGMVETSTYNVLSLAREK